MRSTLGPRRNVVDISPMELFILMSFHPMVYLCLVHTVQSMHQVVHLDFFD